MLLIPEESTKHPNMVMEDGLKLVHDLAELSQSGAAAAAVKLAEAARSVYDTAKSLDVLDPSSVAMESGEVYHNGAAVCHAMEIQNKAFGLLNEAIGIAMYASRSKVLSMPMPSRIDWFHRVMPTQERIAGIRIDYLDGMRSLALIVDKAKDLVDDESDKWWRDNAGSWSESDGR